MALKFEKIPGKNQSPIWNVTSGNMFIGRVEPATDGELLFTGNNVLYGLTVQALTEIAAFIRQQSGEDALYDSMGDCRCCGAPKPPIARVKGRQYSDFELTREQACNTKKECDWEDCDAPLQVAHEICPECRRRQIVPRFADSR